jgi:uncharacterized protein (TIGR02145 family)
MGRCGVAIVLVALATACGGSGSDGAQSGSGGVGGASGGGGIGASGGSGGGAGQDAGSDASTPGSFVDPRDGHEYSEVSIGGSTWMGENLAWEAPSGSFCYENDPVNCATGGRLYEYDVATSACPAGWHLSTDDEWKALETFLGMPAADLDVDDYAKMRGTDQGTSLKTGGDSGLDFPMTGYAATSGNTVTLWDGLTSGVVRTYIWTATQGGLGVYRRRLEQNDTHVFRFSNPSSGFAIVVRCVKD